MAWGYSSAGRALDWQSRGQRFDPAYLHQKERHDASRVSLFGFRRPKACSTLRYLNAHTKCIRPAPRSRLCRNACAAQMRRSAARESSGPWDLFYQYGILKGSPKALCFWTSYLLPQTFAVGRPASAARKTAGGVRSAAAGPLFAGPHIPGERPGPPGTWAESSGYCTQS